MTVTVGELGGDFLSVTAKAARQMLLEAIDRHEQEDHGGELCEGTRLGLLAFLAHSFGVSSSPEMTLALAAELVRYEAQHETLRDGHAE